MASKKTKAKDEEVQTQEEAALTPEPITTPTEEPKMTLDQINQKIAEIDDQIAGLNKQRDDLVEQRKAEANQVIEKSGIKVEDLAGYAEMLAAAKAKIEADLRLQLMAEFKAQAQVDAQNNSNIPKPKTPKVDEVYHYQVGCYFKNEGFESSNQDKQIYEYISNKKGPKPDWLKEKLLNLPAESEAYKEFHVKHFRKTLTPVAAPAPTEPTAATDTPPAA